MRKALAIGGIGFAMLAPLPVVAAEASPHLGVCAAQPVGFFVIPGTDTCLRIGGRVAAEFGTGWRDADWRGFSAPGALAPKPNTLPPRDHDMTRSLVDARLSVDVRSNTELGPVRLYVSVRRPTVLGRP